MFTGIVEEVGRIKAVKRGKNSSVLTVRVGLVTEDVRLGDSIAVNGVCLTVTDFTRETFCADVMHETLRCSSLGELKEGSAVNLERAMKADGRFGGHIVSGHIDGTGKIIGIEKDDNAIWYRIQAEPACMKYIVRKGSVALDGISLTVAEEGSKDFRVSVIPHTRGNTALAGKRVGDIINIETDCIGKYVEKLLRFRDTPQTGGGQSDAGGISREMLAKYGF